MNGKNRRSTKMGQTGVEGRRAFDKEEAKERQKNNGGTKDKGEAKTERQRKARGVKHGAWQKTDEG